MREEGKGRAETFLRILLDLGFGARGTNHRLNIPHSTKTPEAMLSFTILSKQHNIRGRGIIDCGVATSYSLIRIGRGG